MKVQTLEYSELVCRYIEMIKLKEPCIKVTQESVHNLTPTDSSFDYLLLRKILKYLEDYELVLSELLRV